MTREVECPACGGLIIGFDDADLVEQARRHTRDAHGYVVPDDHVLQRAVATPADPPAQ